MGQSYSSEELQSRTKTVSNTEVLKLFNRACLRQFEPIELVSIQSNLQLSDKDKNQEISELELQSLIGIHEDQTHLLKLLYSFIKALAQYPLLKHTSSVLDYHGLTRVITLINHERCTRILSKEFDYTQLIFVCFAIESSYGGGTNEKDIYNQPDTQLLTFKNEHSVNWLESEVIKSFDGVKLSDLYITASDILEIITFLLLISRLEPTETLNIYSQNFKHWDKYKTYSLSLIKTMNPAITSHNIKDHKINYAQFSNLIQTAAPNLLSPLSSVFEPLLFQRHEIIKPRPINTTSPLINEFLLAQLSTFLPKQLVYSNIRKLYSGSDSGFSMRSLESKAFKWNAPSILLLKGKRLSGRNSNIRYKNFKEDFPSFKGKGSPYQDDNDTIIYGVYVDQPWRITNKDFFSGENTIIFQISPVQKIFKASFSSKNHIYFNTLGGGIGIGSQQPLIKNNFKRYQPGNISLTIDSTLEFGVFRNLGIGGEFKSVDLNDSGVEYEDVFLIKNVEVWGCGGEKELEEQNKQWEWEQREVKRRQQINLKSIGEDRALLEMAGLVGQNQSGGSI